MGAVTNDRAIDLINAEIDGALSGPERAELNRLLLADPSVRTLRDELRRTCAALDACGQEDVPADLHESIMAAMPASPIQCDPPASGRFGKPVLRYAAAFAGGLLVSALAFHFAGVNSPGLDPAHLAGTLAPASGASLRIDLPQLKGEVLVAASAGGPVVISRLAATSPVAVIASTEGHEVRLDGFVAPQDAPIELSAHLGKTRSAQPVVAIKVVDGSGTVLHTAALSPNVPN